MWGKDGATLRGETHFPLFLIALIRFCKMDVFAGRYMSLNVSFFSFSQFLFTFHLVFSLSTYVYFFFTLFFSLFT